MRPFFGLPFLHCSQLWLNQRDPGLTDGKACESSLRAILHKIILVLALDWRNGVNLVDLKAKESWVGAYRYIQSSVDFPRCVESQSG